MLQSWIFHRFTLPAPGIIGFTSVADPAYFSFYEILSRLNEIGAAINRQDFNDPDSLAGSLRLIVESAAAVARGSTALIYIFDETTGDFDPDSGVSFGPLSGTGRLGRPRPNGMGWRAITTRQRVLSYEATGLGNLIPLLRS